MTAPAPTIPSARAALLVSLAPVVGWRAAGVSVAAAVAGLATVAFAAAIAHLVDAVIFHGATVGDLAAPLGLLAGLACLRAGATWTFDHLGFEAAARVRRHLLARLLDRLRDLGPVRLADRYPGTVVATLTEAVDGVAPLWRSWQPAATRAVVVPLAVLAVVALADRLAAVLLFIALPLLVWLAVLAGRGAEEASGRAWASLARLGGHLLDQIRGLPETRLAGTADRAIAAVAASATAYGRETMAVLRLAFLSALVLEFVATGAIAGVAIAVGFRLMWGSLDFATGFLVLMLAPEFFAPLRDIGVRRHARIEAHAALDAIADLLADAGDRAADGSEPAPSGPLALRFEGVRVVHSDGRVALEGFDLDVAAGEHVALVGRSGAGKSTVFALLAGFLEPTAGRILVDGRPLAAIDRRTWRAGLVHLPQTPAFFEGSIADAVAMGRPPPSGDRPRDVARALAVAGADFVERLPEGADTPLGERGRDVSGGEAQRLALARAAYAPGPLVLFDEPTAHLDADTERRLGAAIAGLARGRTVLTIAHRLDTLAAVDRVVVLDAGRVVASGPPAEILPRLRAGAPTGEEALDG